MVINGDSFLSNEIAFFKSAESGIWATNERFIEFGNYLHAASIVANVLSGSKPNRDKNSFAFSVICDWIEINSDIPVILGLAIFLVESCLVSVVHLVGNHWWEQWSSCPGPGVSTSSRNDDSKWQIWGCPEEFSKLFSDNKSWNVERVKRSRGFCQKETNLCSWNWFIIFQPGNYNILVVCGF